MEFTELAEAFAAEVEWDESGKKPVPRGFTIRRPGRPDVAVEAEIEGGTCVAARLSVDRPGTEALPRITLRREGRLDRRGKALGINREVQLGDDRFDAAVYIVSAASDAAVQQALARAEARAAVTGILQGVAAELVLGGGRIAARVERDHLGDTPALRVIVDYLVFLRDEVNVPTDLSTAAPPPPPRRTAIAAGLIAPWLALVAAALLLRPPPTLTWSAVISALLIGVMLTLVCLWLLVWRLRGRPDSLRWLLISAACYVPVAPVAGLRLALTLNAALDDGPAIDAAHPVAHLERAGGRVTLDVDGLVAGEARTRLTVPGDRIRGELPDAPELVLFITRPGAFGWPWLAAIAPAHPGPAVVRPPPAPPPAP